MWFCSVCECSSVASQTHECTRCVCVCASVSASVSVSVTCSDRLFFLSVCFYRGLPPLKNLILVLPICFNFFFARRHSLMWNISQGCTTGMPAPMPVPPSATSVGTACQGSRLMASPVKVRTQFILLSRCYDSVVPIRESCLQNLHYIQISQS